MICEQVNHAEYQEKVRRMSMDALQYIIKDCKAALVAMPDGHKAGYYADEINYCASEIYRRRKKKTNE
jgi:hypothetical protein